MVLVGGLKAGLALDKGGQTSDRWSSELSGRGNLVDHWRHPKTAAKTSLREQTDGPSFHTLLGVQPDFRGSCCKTSRHPGSVTS